VQHPFLSLASGNDQDTCAALQWMSMPARPLRGKGQGQMPCAAQTDSMLLIVFQVIFYAEQRKPRQ